MEPIDALGAEEDVQDSVDGVDAEDLEQTEVDWDEDGDVDAGVVVWWVGVHGWNKGIINIK